MARRRHENRRERHDVEELQVRAHEVEIEHQEPQATLREPEPDPRYVLPADQKPPGFYTKIPPLPCQKCRTIRLPSGRQAVIVLAIEKGAVAYLRCKACGHRYALPVR